MVAAPSGARKAALEAGRDPRRRARSRGDPRPEQRPWRATGGPVPARWREAPPGFSRGYLSRLENLAARRFSGVPAGRPLWEDSRAQRRV